MSQIGISLGLGATRGAMSDATAPTLMTAAVNAAGTQLTMVFTEPVTFGAGGNGGFVLNSSFEGAIVPAYASGVGTNTLVFTLGTVVSSSGICTLAYTQPGNGVEDLAGNDLANIAAQAVTNNSAVATTNPFEWHGENTTVTSGTPAGHSTGDTTATANGAVSLDATTFYDGTKSIKVAGANQNYEFAWNNDLLSPTQGTIEFRLRFTTLGGGQTIFELRVDANNRIYIDVDSGGYMSLVRVMGGTITRARLNVGTVTTGKWYYVKARWDSVAHNGLYQSITCDETIGESNSANNGSDAPGTWAGTTGTLKFGDVNGVASVYYLDSIKTYTTWRVAPEVIYVDPSFGGTADGSAAAGYASVSACLAARVNKPLINPVEIRCKTSGGTADTTRVDIGALGQLVTSSSCYLEIKADTGHEAGTAWNSSKYRLEVAYASSTGTAINCPKSYVRLTGLQIGISGTQSGTAEVVYWSGLDLRMSYCMVRGLYSATQTTRCMSVSTAGSTCYLWNNIFYGIGAHNGGATANLQNHGVTYVSSCTFIGYGAINVNNAADGNITLVNCYAGGAITACFQQDPVTTGSWASSYIVSSDSSATGTGSQTGKAVDTTQFSVVSPAGSEDFSIPGSGSALYHTGTNTTGLAAPLNFVDDINRETRVAWDVGADKAA